MKKLILFLLFHLTAYAQNYSNVSVVSAERMNIVYRGIDNPIKIAVPGSKSFTATAPGLVADSLYNGNYHLRAGSGNEVKVIIDAVMQDGKTLHEEKVFVIKGLPRLMATLNGSNCESCIVTIDRSELDSATVEIAAPELFFIDFKSDYFKVESFDILFENNEIINVNGNQLDQHALKKIKKLKDGSYFTIINVRYANPANSCRSYNLGPIKVMILNDPK